MHFNFIFTKRKLPLSEKLLNPTTMMKLFLTVSVLTIVYLPYAHGVGNPELVKDINPGTSWGSYDELTNVNGTLFFISRDDTHGYELWKSDGTESGTHLVKDIRQVSDINPSQHLSELTNVNGMLFFIANDGINGRELWVSDGTEAGTQMLTDIHNVNLVSPNRIKRLASVGNKLFFTVRNGLLEELWKSNGTLSGTQKVDEGYFREILKLTDVNGTLFFESDKNQRNYGLWRSDGTTAGTQFIEINPDFQDQIIDLTAFSDMLFFSVRQGTINQPDSTGEELWKSDGTQNGTRLVADIDPGPDSSTPLNFINANGTLFFTADDGVHGKELWKSDGTQNGTRLVKDLTPGPLEPTYIFGSGRTLFVHINGILFFRADAGTNGPELWRSDGTDAGTQVIADKSSFNGNFLDKLTAVNNMLYFVANSNLWRSDGTSSGMYEIPGFSTIQNLTNVNGTLFFTANDGVHGHELWKITDGNNQSGSFFQDGFESP